MQLRLECGRLHCDQVQQHSSLPKFRRSPLFPSAGKGATATAGYSETQVTTYGSTSSQDKLSQLKNLKSHTGNICIVYVVSSGAARPFKAYRSRDAPTV